MSQIRWGVIADDFTGGTDIAGFLVKSNLRVIQYSGIPSTPLSEEVDAVVISLKSRSTPSDQAISDSLAALAWLQANGCTHIYFKYCSTFDSTEKGNIGPVTDALLKALQSTFTVISPALPVNGRTVYQGNLFVFDQPLHESGMRHHPINPMKDANLMRLMETQAQGKAGLLSWQVIQQGQEAIQARMDELKNAGVQYVVCDALTDDDMLAVAHATTSLRLWTGGSGFAAMLARVSHHGEHGQSVSSGPLMTSPCQAGKAIVLCGSCSSMTLRQINQYKTKAPSMELSVEQCMNNAQAYAQQVLAWIEQQSEQGLAPMVFASQSPEALESIHATYGVEAASKAVESFFAILAKALEARDYQNFIIAGGETSGVVTQALDVLGFHIGPQIAPGVPWVCALDKPLSLALKSGNFGDEHFFEKAQQFGRKA